MAIDERERPILELLDGLGIKYRRYEHPEARTMEDCEHIGEDVGATHFKNLFLTNRQQTDFYMLLISPDKKFRTSEVSKQLGVSRLSFGTDALLMEKLGLLPGSVTPLALMNPNARDITLVIDRDILSMDMVCVHPLVSSASLAMRLDDVLKLVGRFGNKVEYVNICPAEDAFCR